jgi:mannose-6-phosphate isomerase-like protein (cupin superfamily)
MIEEVVFNGILCALIVRRDFNEPGIHFFTPGDFSQQLAYMSRPAGYQIQPHFHREVQRDVHRTQEVLFVRKGRLKVNFYDGKQAWIAERTLEAGDVILLAEGGHGFEMLDDCELFEVKQGPYVGDQDKVRFTPGEAQSGSTS